MHGLTLSLVVGFLLAYSSVWLVSRINDRYTRWEENLCRVLETREKGFKAAPGFELGNRGFADRDELDH